MDFYKYYLMLLILILSFFNPLFSQYHRVSGQVFDAETKLPLGWATITQVGVNRGSSTNSDGKFSFKVKGDSLQIKAFMVGYKNQFIDLKLQNDSANISFFLESAIIEKEEVIVYAEGPGVRLMRKVLKAKKDRMDTMRSYSYDLYSKFVISTDTLTAGRTDKSADTTINSILETYAKSYFKQPDNYFNYIVRKRQSINVPPQANFVSFDNTFNGYQNSVEIFKEEIFTPFHPDAIDFYEFVLEGKIKDDNGKKMHKIRVIPKNNQRKLFTGYIYIDSLNLMPIELELYPNEAVQLPFNGTMSFRQQFILESGFVVPAGLKVYGSASASIFWLYSPRVDIKVVTSQYNYKFNIDLDDDLFNQRKVEISDSADIADEEFWVSNEIIPLSNEEINAYDKIRMSIQNPDSVEGTNIITKYVAPISNKLRFVNLPPFTGWEDLIKYNRITGVRLGLGLYSDLTKTTECRIYSGYGFANNGVNFDLNIKQFFNKNKNFGLDFSFFDNIYRIDNPYMIRDRMITFVALLLNNDYGDYYNKKGYNLGLGYYWGQLEFIRKLNFARPNFIRLFGKYENQNSLSKNTDFSLLGFGTQFRDNPQINNGRYNAIGGELNLSYNREKRIRNIGLYLNYEYSNKKLLNSDFDFKKIYGELVFKIPTMPLWYLDFKITAGINEGDVLPQNFYSIETSTASITSGGTMRSLQTKEFYGDKYLALNFEHNFGEIFPGLIRIPNVASFGLEFILIANAAWTDFNQESKNFISQSIYQYNYTENTKARHFSEIGIGLNKLLLFFRFDLVARLTPGLGPNFVITVSGATF